MIDLRKAAEMALKALENVVADADEYEQRTGKQLVGTWLTQSRNTIEALRTTLAQPDPEHFCDTHCVHTDHHPDCELAQPEQEPVAWLWLSKGKPVNALMRKPNMGDGYYAEKGFSFEPLYTVPPKREWVGLTDEEINDLDNFDYDGYSFPNNLARAIEAKLKEKNNV